MRDFEFCAPLRPVRQEIPHRPVSQNEDSIRDLSQFPKVGSYPHNPFARIGECPDASPYFGPRADVHSESWLIQEKHPAACVKRLSEHHFLLISARKVLD